MDGFVLTTPALAAGGLDRSETYRSAEAVMASWPTAVVLPVDDGDRFPVLHRGRTRLHLLPATDFGGVPPAGAILVGALGGVAHWALPTAEAVAAVAAGSSVGDGVGETAWATMRTVGPILGDDDAAVATTAVALAGWHRRALFCMRCGAATTSDLTGHSRSCAAGHQEFPRTDPAVIVLVHDDAGNAVLARQPSWQPGRYSVLAGFTEAGESLEATVMREMAEEIGVRVDGVRYLGSQPWPFPRSLMIAFSARAPKGAPLVPRDGEIETAGWFSRTELRAILAAERDGRPAADGAVVLPGSMSIARRMVEAFVISG